MAPSAVMPFSSVGSWNNRGNLEYGVMNMGGLYNMDYGMGYGGGYYNPLYMTRMTNDNRMLSQTINNQNAAREEALYGAVETYCEYIKNGYEHAAYDQIKQIADLIKQDETLVLTDKNGNFSEERLKAAIRQRLDSYTRRNYDNMSIIDFINTYADSRITKSLLPSCEGFHDTICNDDLIAQISNYKPQNNLKEIAGMACTGIKGTAAITAGVAGCAGIIGSSTTWLAGLGITSGKAAVAAVFSKIGGGLVCAAPVLAGIAALGLIGYGLYSIFAPSDKDKNNNPNDNSSSSHNPPPQHNPVRTDNSIPYAAALQGNTARPNPQPRTMVVTGNGERIDTSSQPIIIAQPLEDAQTTQAQADAAKAERINELKKTIQYLREMISFGHKDADYQGELNQALRELRVLEAANPQ